MIVNLTDNETAVLTDALEATVKQLDAIMETTPSREVADASNTLMDILDKLKGKSNENQRTSNTS